MNICFFTTSYASHKQVRLSYAEKYLPKSVKIFLLTPKQQNKYSLKRTKIVEISSNKLKAVIEARKFCKRNKIDVLTNLGTFREAWVLLLASIFNNVRYIINIHGNAVESYISKKDFLSKTVSFIETLLFGIPLAFSEVTIFGAKDQAEKARKLFFPSKKKIVHLPLIIDEKIFKPINKKTARRKLKLPLNKKIVVFVGRVEWLKGCDILYSLAKSNQDKLFMIIGQEKNKIFSENILKNVLIVKPQQDKKLALYYNAADVCLLPSRVEGFGLVPREAMLCGTPAIVSDITALKSIPRAIVAKNTLEEMQKKLDFLLSLSEKEKEKIGAASRKAIINETSYRNLKEKYLDLFYRRFVN